MINHKMIVGNWKMNPATLEEAKKIARMTRRLANNLKNIDVVICPPFPFIAACISRTKPDKLHFGAQTVSFEEGGSHTGEISSIMLSDIGVEYVIVGHSEEREKGVTDDVISKKIAMTLEAGMIPIVCVGENDRDENGSHFEFIKNQMKNTFANVPKKYSSEIVLAYEPVWAIGGKESMMPEQIYEMSLFVKKIFVDIFGQESSVKVKVLYGGSVTYRNAADIIITGKVEGLLVGRESVNIAGFLELLKVADEIA